jgi:hypothetical protein
VLDRQPVVLFLTVKVKLYVPAALPFGIEILRGSLWVSEIYEEESVNNFV